MHMQDAPKRLRHEHQSSVSSILDGLEAVAPFAAISRVTADLLMHLILMQMRISVVL